MGLHKRVCLVSSSASHYRLSYSPVNEHVVCQPPAWSATSLPVHAARLLCREGVPHLPRVLPAASDEEAPFQCYYIYKKKNLKSPALERGSTPTFLRYILQSSYRYIRNYRYFYP